jgi:hypothetical protein
MDLLKQYLGHLIDVNILGDKMHTGILVDLGPDILVLTEESKYFYIPLYHISHVTLHPIIDSNLSVMKISSTSESAEISFPLILEHAKMAFCEIYLADHQMMYGHIADIQSDYFVFMSPLDKMMMIPSIHLKWISPFESSATPYSLKRKLIDPQNQSKLTFAQTFEEQLKLQEGSIISINDGLRTNKVGYLHKFENHILELVAADEIKHYYLDQHIKNVCL